MSDDIRHIEIQQDNAEHAGDVERLQIEKAAEARGIDAERDRCVAIVQMARMGEIDQDWRAIISIIEGGMTLEQIKQLCT